MCKTKKANRLNPGVQLEEVAAAGRGLVTVLSIEEGAAAAAARCLINSVPANGEDDVHDVGGDHGTQLVGRARWGRWVFGREAVVTGSVV